MAAANTDIADIVSERKAVLVRQIADSQPA